MRSLIFIFFLTTTILLVWHVASVSAIKFVDRDGIVCGCLVDQDYPTKDQCRRISGKAVEKITVSTCN